MLTKYPTFQADRATNNGVEALGKYYSPNMTTNTSMYDKNVNKQIDFAQESVSSVSSVRREGGGGGGEWGRRSTLLT